MKRSILHLHAAEFFPRDFPFAALRIRTDFVPPQWHDHDFYEMVFVVRGSGVHKTLSQKTPLHRGRVYLLGRGEPHCFETSGLLENLTFLLSPALFETSPLREAAARHPRFHLPDFLAGKTGGFHSLALGLPKFAVIHPLLEGILAEFTARRADYETVVRCELARLFILLERALKQAPEPVPDGHATRVMEYIRGHYSEPITLDSLAQGLGLQASSLSRLFPKKTGFRVMEYVKEVRIQKATELLRHGDMPVIQVAQETGFTGLSAFYEAFKKATGVSPLSLRRGAGTGQKSGKKG